MAQPGVRQGTMDSTPDIRNLLTRFSTGQITAVEARARLGDVTYGRLLSLLASENLPLPNSPRSGREPALARARAWMFPDHAA